MLHNKRLIIGTFRAVAVLGGALIAVPVAVLAADPAANQTVATQAPAAPIKLAPATPPADQIDHVEERIKDLHTRLRITPEQEVKWSQVAEVMRANAKELRSLIGDRTQGFKTMTALDDLQSYEKIAAAHDDGLKRFIPAFQALYAAMSDTQKKNADTVFRTYQSPRRAGAS